MMWARGVSLFKLGKSDVTEAVPAGKSIPTIIATTTTAPAQARTSAEQGGYASHDDVTLVTSSRQFLSPDVGPSHYFHGHHHHHHHHHGVTSGATTSPGVGGLERVPSANRLQPQSSTETSGLGETLTSGFSSQESVHSAASCGIYPSASSHTIAAVNPSDDRDDYGSALVTRSSPTSAAYVKRASRVSNPSLQQESRASDVRRSERSTLPHLVRDRSSGSGGGSVEGRLGGAVLKRQDALWNGHSSSGVRGHTGAQSEGGAREERERGRRKRAAEARHASSADCVKECDVASEGGGCGGSGGGGDGGVRSSSGSSSAGRGEVTAPGEIKPSGGSFGERSRRGEIDRTLSPRGGGRARDAAAAGGAEDRRGHDQRPGAGSGHTSPPDRSLPPAAAAADRPRGRERDSSADREPRDKVSARRPKEPEEVRGKTGAREKDVVSAGRSASSKDAAVKTREDLPPLNIHRQKSSRSSKSSERKSVSSSSHAGTKEAHTFDREHHQHPYQHHHPSAKEAAHSSQPPQNPRHRELVPEKEGWRRGECIQKHKSRECDARASLDRRQARDAAHGNRPLEKQPSRDSGRGRSPEVQTPEVQTPEEVAPAGRAQCKAEEAPRYGSARRSHAAAGDAVAAREFDQSATGGRGERTARRDQSSADSRRGEGSERLHRVRHTSLDEASPAGSSYCERSPPVGSGRGAASRGSQAAAERGQQRSRDARDTREARGSPPDAARGSGRTAPSPQQVSSGEIKASSRSRQEIPSGNPRPLHASVTAAVAHPVSSSSASSQRQRGSSAAGYEEQLRQRNARTGWDSDRKSVDRGKLSEASRQPDDDPRHRTSADRASDGSTDAGQKSRRADGAPIATRGGSKHRSETEPLTLARDSSSRQVRQREDGSRQVEGQVSEPRLEQRTSNEEKTNPAKALNLGAELRGKKFVRRVEGDFAADSTEGSRGSEKDSCVVRTGRPRVSLKGGETSSQVGGDSSRVLGRHKLSDLSRESKTAQDSKTIDFSQQKLTRSAEQSEKGEAHVARGREERARPARPAEQSHSAAERGDQTFRQARDRADRPAGASLVTTDADRSKRHLSAAGERRAGHVAEARGQVRDARAVTEVKALRTRLDGGDLPAAGGSTGSSMGADGKKPPADGKPPTTIVTVTSPTSPPDPEAVFQPTPPPGRPSHPRAPVRVPLYQRRLGNQDRLFDDLFSQAGGGRREGTGPGGLGGASGRRSPSLVVTGPSGSPVQGLQVDQIDQEWERRESRGSLRSNRSRSSHGGSFHSRAGSLRHAARYLALNSDSAWSRWSRDRRASYRRRIELLDKPEQNLTRVSTPIRKARQEGLKFVHPDLEGTYLSEEDLNALRRHKQQKYHAIRVIEKNRKGKFRMKTKVHLTAEQWQVLGDFWEHPAFVRGRYLGLVFMFLAFLVMVISITNSNWVTYEAFNLTIYEGLWVNCTTPLPNPTSTVQTCRSTAGRGFSGGMWQSCYQNLSDPEAYSKCPEKRAHWQNAVIGLMIFAASFGVLASVLSICGVCTTPLPRKIYYFHSAGEIFLICALSTGVALMVFPIAIEIDRTISSHKYGIGYGLGWGGAFFFLAAAVCMSLDDLVRESSRTKCCRWCWKSKQNDRTELRQV